MTVLLLRLAGPMQAWGDSSRFSRRETRTFPTKSGVLGLLAAADGRRRSDPIEDLARLRFGVRVDQPGTLLKDFQTAINWDTKQAMPLSYRYYISDAVFVAGVEGDRSLLESLHEAVTAPHFPLYLGRRSCPVSGEVSLGLSQHDLETALRQCPWKAARWHRRRQPRTAHLELFMDADGLRDQVVETRRDVPLSFSPECREYVWREVAHLIPEAVPNPEGYEPAPFVGHDWLAAVEEA